MVHHERFRMPSRIWIWSNIRNSVNQIHALSFGSHFFDPPMISQVSSKTTISTIIIEYESWTSYPSKQTHQIYDHLKDLPHLRHLIQTQVCVASTSLFAPYPRPSWCHNWWLHFNWFWQRTSSNGGCFMFRVYERNRILGCGGCDNLSNYSVLVQLDIRKIIHLQYTVRQPKDPKIFARTWGPIREKIVSESSRHWRSITAMLVRTSRHGNACGPYAMPLGPFSLNQKAVLGRFPMGQIRKHVLWTLRWMMLRDFLCQELLVNHFGIPLHGNSHFIKTTLSCAWLPIATLSTLLSKAHAVCHRLVRILQAGVGDGHARWAKAKGSKMKELWLSDTAYLQLAHVTVLHLLGFKQSWQNRQWPWMSISVHHNK